MPSTPDKQLQIPLDLLQTLSTEPPVKQSHAVSMPSNNIKSSTMLSFQLTFTRLGNCISKKAVQA